MEGFDGVDGTEVSLGGDWDEVFVFGGGGIGVVGSGGGQEESDVSCMIRVEIEAFRAGRGGVADSGKGVVVDLGTGGVADLDDKFILSRNETPR